MSARKTKSSGTWEEREKEKKEKKSGVRAIPEHIRTGWYLWMFTLPVMLDTFYQVSVAGILWNLVVIPLLPIVIASGGMGVLLAGWKCTLGSVAGSPAYGLLKVYQ